MIDVNQLKDLIKVAMDASSNVQVDPALAREQFATALAVAIASFVQGRQTIVTGTSPAGPVTGTGVIQ